jgi:hypothetical protein
MASLLNPPVSHANGLSMVLLTRLFVALSSLYGPSSLGLQLPIVFAKGSQTLVEESVGG